jgi:hypothetical protein
MASLEDRFDLRYVAPDGSFRRPWALHRAPLGIHEQFVAFPIEHFAGAFPLRLAPAPSSATLSLDGTGYGTPALPGEFFVISCPVGDMLSRTACLSVVFGDVEVDAPQDPKAVTELVSDACEGGFIITFWTLQGPIVYGGNAFRYTLLGRRNELEQACSGLRLAGRRYTASAAGHEHYLSVDWDDVLQQDVDSCGVRGGTASWPSGGPSDTLGLTQTSGMGSDEYWEADLTTDFYTSSSSITGQLVFSAAATCVPLGTVYEQEDPEVTLDLSGMIRRKPRPARTLRRGQCWRT